MKKSSLFAASITTATIVTGSNIGIQTSHQDDEESSKRNSSSEKKNHCLEILLPRENTFGCKFFIWKEERVRVLVGSPGASTTSIYSPGSSSTLIYSPGYSTPPRYSPGASTPPSYSRGTSRNAECSNCKYFLDKITVLEATKFNLEANAEINFSFKLSSFDFVVDITDDAENKKNEGTVTRIKIDNKGVFEMLFIAIGASICTFLNYLRPMLMIDVAHLKGLYKGTNLVAVAMDGNNKIVPIAFAICKGETGHGGCRCSKNALVIILIFYSYLIGIPL
ncbi:hypothetical protein Tco_0625800 [Tanacetum coccineum]|uniref:Uncharacterized protein n=1 Tax=Tanacetum coccineum TaxID=301880 RepID=A0ABQ4WHS5_9ASTR